MPTRFLPLPCCLALALSACGEDASPSLAEDGHVRDVASGGLDSYDPPPVPEGIAIAATVETEPVANEGDSADDPAIWVHPTKPELSLVLGTDKGMGGGLYVYELDGKVRQFFEVGELNNADLRPFTLEGKELTLVTGVERGKNELAILALDHDTRMLRDVKKRAVEVTPAGYGSCMYRSAAGETYAFVDSTAGVIEQYRLVAAGAQVDAELVRSFCVPTQPEACVVDDATGTLYLGEESLGIWKFTADPAVAAVGDVTPECEGAVAGSLLDTVMGEHLTADIEGLGLAVTGADSGYLFVSSQGAHEFVVYDRKPPHAHVMTFHVFGGGPACLDGVEGSDGIDVTSAALGPAFPRGVFVTQDGYNGDPFGHQNFKLVPLDHVLDKKAPATPAACRLGDYGGKDRQGPALPGPEHTPEFCMRFCMRCDECYATVGVAGGFAEGDCHYQSPKPAFALDDCLAGCTAGITPADTSPLQPGWELLECVALDDAL